MRRPGDLAAVGLLAAGVATSAVLCAAGHDSICTCVRANRALRVLAVAFAVHAAFNVPHDPLRWVGSLAVHPMRRRLCARS